MTMGSKSVLGVLAAGLAAAVFVPLVWADITGRVRIIDMNGRRFEGEVKELPDAYKVRQSNGITMMIKKSEVKEIIRLEPRAKEKTSTDALRTVTRSGSDVSDEEIAAILGEDWIESENAGPVTGADAVLTADMESIDEMRRIADTDTLIETDHFVLVYTSDRALALKLSARLEATYRWMERFMKMVDLEAVAPEHKLEIYFYRDHQGYKSYGSTVGGIPDWAAGFYMRTNNRSAFYDMNKSPRVVKYLEQLERASMRRRRFYQNRIKRYQDFVNLTVIQHEAAHHIHFNIGLFSKRGDIPTWVTEGLAQMFELPSGKRGGSLGTINHYRLADFQGTYNPKFRGNRNRLTKLRLFVSDDSTWDPGKHYSYGWALTHYLWKKHRPQYAEYLHRLNQREDDKRLSATEQLQEFEDIFGPADDKFQKDFLDYIFAQRVQRSALDF